MCLLSLKHFLQLVSTVLILFGEYYWIYSPVLAGEYLVMWHILRLITAKQKYLMDYNLDYDEQITLSS